MQVAKDTPSGSPLPPRDPRVGDVVRIDSRSSTRSVSFARVTDVPDRHGTTYTAEFIGKRRVNVRRDDESHITRWDEIPGEPLGIFVRLMDGGRVRMTADVRHWMDFMATGKHAKVTWERWDGKPVKEADYPD